AESPGQGPLRLVALVGNGTVSALLPAGASARACPRSTPARVEFTTGGPKPLSTKPPPPVVNGAGGRLRSIELGVRLITQGAQGCVSLAVSVLLVSGEIAAIARSATIHSRNTRFIALSPSIPGVFGTRPSHGARPTDRCLKDSLLCSPCMLPNPGTAK